MRFLLLKGNSYCQFPAHFADKKFYFTMRVGGGGVPSGKLRFMQKGLTLEQRPYIRICKCAQRPGVR